MNSIPLSLHLDKEYLQILDCVDIQLRQKMLPLVVSGMPPVVEKAFLASFCKDFYEKHQKCILLLVKDDKSVIQIADYLKSEGVKALRFLRRELNIYNISASHENEHERLLVLSKLLSGGIEAVVATPAAAMSITMPREVLDRNKFFFGIGDIDEPQDMVLRLVNMGYTRVENVEYVGQFSARGGIIDIFPPLGNESENNPYRIEFFDNEIDRICIFDRMSQRVIENRDFIEILPVREVLYDNVSLAAVKKEIKECLKKCGNSDSEKELEGELAAIDGGQPLNFMDKYISLIYPEKECLLDYLGSETAVLLSGTNAINEQIDAVERLDGEIISTLLEHGTVRNGKTQFSVDASIVKAFLESNLVIHLNTFAVGLSGVKISGMFSMRCRQLTSYFKKYELLKEDLSAFVKGKYKILLACENDAEVKSMLDALVSDGFQAVVAGSEPEKFATGVVYVAAEKLDCGFELFGPKFAALTLYSDDSNRFKSGRRKNSKKVKNGQKILSYADLEIGDYVVHTAYGIGKYLGIQNLTVGGVSRDYINIQYAGTDKLFLPVDNLDMVSKYIGAHSDDGLLKLSKMGGTDWQKAKSKAKAAVKDMAKDLIKLYAERMRRSGYAFPADDQMQRDFETAFEYEETDSQLAAIEEIKRDMMHASPMDRLLCGDVGFGKTEVALRAAFKAMEAGKQVALLVPTTILALQHYHTAVSRMRNFPVKVDMISRFRTPQQQKAILRSVKRGQTDMIIGTHRLISSDVEFKDLGLVIVDEEQRFGVAQKEKLKQIAKNVDVLSLSATPIPRTLNMALGGLRDMSVLDEPPEDRLPVQTYVLEHDNIIIEEAIRRELARGGQVFYLYNRVDSIEYVASRIARDNPTATVAVAHGKMERDEIEEIWHAMIDGSIDILICTTIIETGVDVPNANTLIIEDADRMGLSQLHQLRGRVGRS
ncbi:MAG: transcription-repair coupling factor [Clostridia bacterium]|nr:transcription-repair coupling factor [Clostridia bacterium]